MDAFMNVMEIPFKIEPIREFYVLVRSENAWVRDRQKHLGEELKTLTQSFDVFSGIRMRTYDEVSCNSNVYKDGCHHEPQPS